MVQSSYRFRALDCHIGKIDFVPVHVLDKEHKQPSSLLLAVLFLFALLTRDIRIAQRPLDHPLSEVMLVFALNK